MAPEAIHLDPKVIYCIAEGSMDQPICSPGPLEAEYMYFLAYFQVYYLLPRLGNLCSRQQLYNSRKQVVTRIDILVTTCYLLQPGFICSFITEDSDNSII